MAFASRLIEVARSLTADRRLNRGIDVSGSESEPGRAVAIYDDL